MILKCEVVFQLLAVTGFLCVYLQGSGAVAAL